MHPGGMGPSYPGRIPWSSIVSWCEFYDMTKGEMAILDKCFEGMDEEYMQWWIEQLPPDATGKTAPRIEA